MARFSFFVLAVLLFGFSSVFASDDSGKSERDREPIVYVSFDVDLNDVGPFKLRGFIFGDEVQLRPGKMGQALFVGGTEDWVEMPLDDRINLNDGASVEIWFRREDWINPYHGGSGFQTFVVVTSDMMMDVTSSACPVAPPWALLTSMTHYDEEAGESDVVRAHSEPNSIPPDEWMHGAVTYDPHEATLTLYLNGEEIDKAYGVPRQEFDIRIIRLGTWFKANQAFRGYVDELKVYDYIRSADEVFLEAHFVR
ncbi:MAG: LamG domain-containing protein [Gammaproteobacteria bacterium]|jgi:hypothetical protein|nr:LamG domain-containing protein [Gammaproteobacteria bacterium]MBT4492005.1 LamG domain-containing protein [Gammaproteobacteria bacterium]MBT7369377.1 LamG domain-containing protein [Gammaproteobacteria bacterium]